MPLCGAGLTEVSAITFLSTATHNKNVVANRRRKKKRAQKRGVGKENKTTPMIKMYHRCEFLICFKGVFLSYIF